jgi:hypothetical protein
MLPTPFQDFPASTPKLKNGAQNIECFNAALLGRTTLLLKRGICLDI